MRWKNFGRNLRSRFDRHSAGAHRQTDRQTEMLERYRALHVYTRAPSTSRFG